MDDNNIVIRNLKIKQKNMHNKLLKKSIERLVAAAKQVINADMDNISDKIKILEDAIRTYEQYESEEDVNIVNSNMNDDVHLTQGNDVILNRRQYSEYSGYGEPKHGW